jgi:hypothetical protein
MVADIVRIDARLKNQFDAARRLGNMIDDGALSDDLAQMVMDEIINVAQRNAPDLAPNGVHTHLVWARNDARDAAYYARIRAERQQERDLTNIAEAAYRARLPEREVRRRVADAAMEMTPLPAEETLWAALRVGAWRVKHGR